MMNYFLLWLRKTLLQTVEETTPESSRRCDSNLLGEGRKGADEIPLKVKDETRAFLQE